MLARTFGFDDCDFLGLVRTAAAALTVRVAKVWMTIMREWSDVVVHVVVYIVLSLQRILVVSVPVAVIPCVRILVWQAT